MGMWKGVLEKLEGMGMEMSQVHCLYPHLLVRVKISGTVAMDQYRVGRTGLAQEKLP